MDNVLFGRIGHKHPDGPERIRAIVRDLLDELGLYDDVLDVGLDFNVGVGGRRLTVAQRQKIDVARALLKRADYHHLQPADAASSTSACRTRSCATSWRRRNATGASRPSSGCFPTRMCRNNSNG